MCSSGGMHGSQETRTKMQSLENGVITWYYIRCHVMKDQGYHVKTFTILSFFQEKWLQDGIILAKYFKESKKIQEKKYSDLLSCKPNEELSHKKLVQVRKTFKHKSKIKAAYVFIVVCRASQSQNNLYTLYKSKLH